MQITGGTITLSNGSNNVVGSSECDWSQVVTNCWLIVGGKDYLILSSTNSPTKSLTISPDWDGVGVATTDYVIVRDFTTNVHLPLLNPGDMEAPALWSRAMTIIDSLIGAIAGGTTDPETPTTITFTGEELIQKNNHGFIIGNILRYDAVGNSWALADAGAASSAHILAMVSSVVDANNFRIKTSGRVGNISGLSMVTPGTIYYLKADVAPGSPNITSVAPTLKIPVITMLSNVEGFLMSLANAESGLVNSSSPGLVPAPGTSTGRYLKDDLTWSAVTVANGSLTTTHLDSSSNTIDWTGWLAKAGSLNIMGHVGALHTRLLALEEKGSATESDGIIVNRRDVVVAATDPYTWQSNSTLLPDEITKIRIRVVSGCYIIKRNNVKDAMFPDGSIIDFEGKDDVKLNSMPSAWDFNLYRPGAGVLSIKVYPPPDVVVNAPGMHSATIEKGAVEILVGTTVMARVSPKKKLYVGQKYSKSALASPGIVSFKGVSGAGDALVGPLLSPGEINPDPGDTSVLAKTSTAWYKYDTATLRFTFSGAAFLEFGGSTQYSF